VGTALEEAPTELLMTIRRELARYERSGRAGGAQGARCKRLLRDALKRHDRQVFPAAVIVNVQLEPRAGAAAGEGPGPRARRAFRPLRARPIGTTDKSGGAAGTSTFLPLQTSYGGLLSSATGEADG
jgi:hypothetical protein